MREAIVACLRSFLSVAGAHAQAPTWLRARVLESKITAAITFDAARECVLLFGGDPSACDSCPDRSSDETWEWTGAAWTRRDPAVRPSARWGSAVAYDRARQRVVLFGGRSFQMGFDHGDTWEWDGTTWLRRTHATPLPGYVFGASLAYDELRQRTVMVFSSTSGTGTWEWDGVDWSLRSAVAPPFGRMLYDSARQRVVVFRWAAVGEVWEWSGTAWVLHTTVTFPQQPYNTPLVFDRARQRAVLFGSDLLGNPQTWEWDGTRWLLLQPLHTPPARDGADLVYDEARGVTLLFGGQDGASSGTERADVWAFDGRDWTELSARTTPRYVQAMAYDVMRERTVLVANGTTPALETWEWEGRSWTRRAASVTPPPRWSPGLVYDVRRQHSVLFGGNGQGQTLGDTWVWDGSAWTPRTPTASPAPRIAPVMAYDLARDRTVLFGGQSGSTTLDDTWEWNGTTWAQRTPATRPRPGTWSNALAYDVLRQRTVLIACFGSLRPVETWEWDGVDWSLRASTGPTLVYGSAAYDLARGRVVAVGDPDFGFYTPQTWEWDGATWTRLPLPVEPVGFPGGTVAYDLARRQLVLFSFDAPSGPWTQTWLLGAHTPVVSQASGAGCAGSRGVPRLRSNEPYSGNDVFALHLLPVLPSVPAVFGVSLGTRSVPIGPCTLYLADPVVWMPVSANAAGGALIQLPLPPDPSVRGFVLFAQGFAVDPLGGALGLVFSEALRLVVGD